MIGVVVWSSLAREQAVIWCDDHAALAYLSGREDLSAGDHAWPDAGAILELDSETVGTVRYARNVRAIPEAPRSALPHLLRREKISHLSLVHDRVAESPAPIPAPQRRSARG